VIYVAAYLGVQIFFVISGFVICRLLLREEARYGSFSLEAFYIRRVFRILPPFYLLSGSHCAAWHARGIPGNRLADRKGRTLP
jgi:peptidoglycan/LPS O-acetylase OafA/YrhL